MRKAFTLMQSVRLPYFAACKCSGERDRRGMPREISYKGLSPLLTYILLADAVSPEFRPGNDFTMHRFLVKFNNMQEKRI